MMFTVRWWLVGLVPWSAMAAPTTVSGPLPAPLELEDTLGRRHVLNVELALDPERRQRGLMYRRSMAAGHGMLFVFPVVKPHKMWMRNTLMALDMLFLDSAGAIVAIAPRCRPLSQALIGPDEPVRAVLELGAGEAARLGLVPGARLVRPSLDGLPTR